MAKTIAQGVCVQLTGLLAAAVLVVAMIALLPDVVLTDGFYWVSAAGVLVVNLAAGAVAGRLAAPRLARAGAPAGRIRYALAAAGPVVVALLTNLNPISGIPMALRVVLPVCAAAGGVAVGLWHSARVERREPVYG
ncbi:hypothetical protein DPM19_28760 [Actinomadura craniellae]|uniref:Uncharacterized protein n=1 Tax=Actinomadura craniellae TaxID=2231787 RepID=A0A365H095_9ACTN|nr:hypothetical protein DPM19_28760 [Actinomadura craniellae]